MISQLTLPALGTVAPLLSLHYIVHWSTASRHYRFNTLEQAENYREDHPDGWDMTIEAVEDEDDDAPPNPPTP